MLTRVCLVVLALTSGVGMAARVSAQEAPTVPPGEAQGRAIDPRQTPGDPRLQRGIRGRDVVNLTLEASAGTDGWGRIDTSGGTATLVDTNIVSDLRSRVTLRPLETPVSWQVTGDIAYRGYDDREFVPLGRTLGTSAAFDLTSSTRISAFGSVGYQRYFALALPTTAFSGAFADGAVAQAMTTALGTQFIPAALIGERSGMLPASAIDFAVAASPATWRSVGVSLSQQLTSRANATVQAAFNRTDYSSNQNRDSRDYGLSGYLGYRIFNGVGLRVGYSRQVADYFVGTGPDTVLLENIDAGLDIARGFALTRRGLTLGARTGALILTDGRDRRVYLTGNVSLTQAIGRYSRVYAGYDRGDQLAAGFVRPVITDSIIAGAGGRVFGGSSWVVAASRSLGSVINQQDVGFSSNGHSYHTTTGTARLTFPVGRRAGIYLEYLAYQQDIDNSVDVLNVLRLDDVRQTGRVGVTLDIPLLRDERPPRRERR